VENPNNPKRTWGCFLEGVPVGALVGGQLNNNVSYLEFIWLDPKLRQEGYGIQLLNTFENQQRRDGIKRIETEVYDSRSLEWAKRQGYQVVHKEGNMSCLLKLLD
jgi:GNAT superfamily N-acetyltransferase